MVNATQSKQIIVNNVCFRIENTAVNFDGINLAFGKRKYAIVGDNGSGKTTLLKLIAGEIKPDGGLVQCDGVLCQLPQQHDGYAKTASIAEVLGVATMMKAIKHINEGSCSEADFECVDSNWDIEQRCVTALEKFQLSAIDINEAFFALSGGQKTKVLLAKTDIFPADFLLLDEPTNNLDQSARSVLYDYVKQSDQAMIVVSHDRTLLNQVDSIIELTSKGLREYGGNYDFYCRQKTLEQNALDRQYQDAKEAIEKTKRNIQQTREKHEQLASRGKKAFRQGDVDRMSADSKKERSEKTKSRMTTLESSMIEQKTKRLRQINERREFVEVLDVSLDATAVAKGKQVLAIEKLCFQYVVGGKAIIDSFNLEITGARRIALSGPNGSGKTTLVQLIQGELSPTRGDIKVGVDNVCYLDQQLSFLDPSLTVIGNFLKINPKATEFEAHSSLAKFKFRNVEAHKLVSQLSGGEKMRAGLAISLMSTAPPQLLILDEPTNHLDLKSIQAIEAALAVFQGAMMVISHDATFLTNIGIEEIVGL